MQQRINWHDVRDLSKVGSYTCGFCGHLVASQRGWHGEVDETKTKVFVILCPKCTYPTFWLEDLQVPGERLGRDVEGVDEKSIVDLYNEARECTAARAYTAAVMCCRKLLMHLAVAKGANEGKGFKEYVDYLSAQGYVPPDGKSWVDRIRQAGNEANHEIVICTHEAANQLLNFVENLLRFIYEMPYKMRSVSDSDSVAPEA